MSVQSQLNRIEQAKTDIASAIEAKGVTVTSGTKIDGMSSLIASISQGEDLDDEIATQDSLISQIQTALADKIAPDAGGGGGGGSIETCTVNLISQYGSVTEVMYNTVDSSGKVVSLGESTGQTSYTITDVVCGSVVVVCYSGQPIIPAASVSDSSIQILHNMTYVMVFNAQTTAGSSATVTRYDAD